MAGVDSPVPWPSAPGLTAGSPSPRVRAPGPDPSRTRPPCSRLPHHHHPSAEHSCLAVCEDVFVSPTSEKKDRTLSEPHLPMATTLFLCPFSSEASRKRCLWAPSRVLPPPQALPQGGQVPIHHSGSVRVTGDPTARSVLCWSQGAHQQCGRRVLSLLPPSRPPPAPVLAAALTRVSCPLDSGRQHCPGDLTLCPHSLPWWPISQCRVPSRPHTHSPSHPRVQPLLPALPPVVSRSAQTSCVQPCTATQAGPTP